MVGVQDALVPRPLGGGAEVVVRQRADACSTACSRSPPSRMLVPSAEHPGSRVRPYASNTWCDHRNRFQSVGGCVGRIREVQVRVALLSYRSKPHCGGQGVYVRHLSRELVALGHDVEVFSGQPYPELDPGVRLTKVPSLDLYREPDPFRTPAARRDPRPDRRARGRDDVDRRLPRAAHLQPARRPAAARAARRLRRRARQPDARLRDPRRRARRPARCVTTIHHPITFDRRVDLAAAPTWRRRLALRRWYGFVRMQGRVARRLRTVLTVSESSARDIVADFGVRPDADPGGAARGRRRVRARPREPRVPGRIVAMASADTPDEGDRHPAGGVRQAAHRARRRAPAGRHAPSRAARPSSSSTGSASVTRVRFVHGITDERAGRGRRLGRGRLRAVPLRGLLAADRRGDGLRDAAGGEPGRGHPRGRRARRALRRPGHPRGRGRARARPRERSSTTRSAAPGWAPPAAQRALAEFSWRRWPRPTVRGLPARDRRSTTRRRLMLTVDFDRLGLQPGDRVLDMGCGAGRHAFEMFRRGADVIAFDQDGDELAAVLDLFGAMRDAGEVPTGAEADIKQGDALALPVRGRRVRPGRRLPRCSSTSPTTRRRSPSWRGCCVPAARSP